jgi:hypothetical protein
LRHRGGVLCTLDHAEDREERHGRAGALHEMGRRRPRRGAEDGFPRRQAERRASYTPIVRPAGSSGPSVMTPILFSEIATSFGFAPTAKSVGPRSRTRRRRHALDTDRCRPGLARLRRRPQGLRGGRGQDISAPRTRAELFGASVEPTPRESKRRKSRRTPIPFFKNVAPPNARDLEPRRTSGLRSMSSRYLRSRFSRAGSCTSIRRLPSPNRASAPLLGEFESWSLDLRGPEPRRTGACSEGGNL